MLINYIIFILYFTVISTQSFQGQIHLGQPINNILNTNLYQCVYYQLNIQSFQGRKYIFAYYQQQLLENQTVYTYLQIKTSIPTDCNLPQIGILANQNVDINGYALNHKQRPIYRLGQINLSNLYLTIYLSNYTGLKPRFNYNIRVDVSQNNSQCINNCSNVGICTQNAICMCPIDRIGYDCSLIPLILDINSDIILNIPPNRYHYLLIPQYLSKDNPILNIMTSSIRKNDMELCFSIKKNNLYIQVATRFMAFQCFILKNSSNNYPFQLIRYNNDLIAVIYNYESSQIQLRISLVYSQNKINLLFIILITIGSLLFVALIASFIFFLYKKNPSPQLRLQQIQEEQKLSDQQIIKYFPSIFYQKLSKKLQKQQYHISAECAICLSNFNSEDKICLTYCNHIFNQQCLMLWFKRQRNCPNCRQIFNRPKILQYYNKIIKQEQQIFGDYIIQKILEYYKFHIHQKYKQQDFKNQKNQKTLDRILNQ